MTLRDDLARANALVTDLATRIVLGPIDYDGIMCHFCDGMSVMTDERPAQYVRLAEDDDRRGSPCVHDPDCVYVIAHRIIGRDLAPHTVRES